MSAVRGRRARGGPAVAPCRGKAGGCYRDPANKITRAGPHLAEVLHMVADEAVLPAGFTLARPNGTGLSCFLLLSGLAVVERHGHRHYAAVGSLLCELDENGRPGPPSGVTISLAEPSHVLIIDAARLAELIDADPTLAPCPE